MNYHDGIATELGLKKLLIFQIIKIWHQKMNKDNFGPKCLGSQS